MAWVIGVALFAWSIGVVVLGQQWHGEQRAPGVWVDGVSLTQWLACWAALAALGMCSATRLRTWAARVLALLPVVSWIAWQLRGGALGPLPMLIYITPTVLVWCGALAVGTWLGTRLARSVNGTRA